MEPTRANVVGSLRSIGVVAARLILNVLWREEEKGDAVCKTG
jgi:hypothetical protein